ncbi:unnamed protein product, partial [Candidula unifasciata]
PVPGTCTLCDTMDCVLSAAHLINNMNTSADPCEDFNEFACGRYIKESQFPPGRSHISSATAVSDRNTILLRNIILEESSPSHPEYLRKMKKFYQSCVDEAQIEVVGLEPYFNDTEFTDDWPTLNPNWTDANFNLNELIVRYMVEDVEPLFSITVSTDMNDSTTNVIEVSFVCLFARGSDSGRRVVVNSSVYALSFSHFCFHFVYGIQF